MKVRKWAASVNQTPDAKNAPAIPIMRTCGLVNEEAACRCKRQVAVHIHFDFIGPDKMSFSRHPTKGPAKTLEPKRLQGLVEIERVAKVFRSHPEYAAPPGLVEGIRSFIAKGGFRTLDE